MQILRSGKGVSGDYITKTCIGQTTSITYDNGKFSGAKTTQENQFFKYDDTDSGNNISDPFEKEKRVVKDELYVLCNAYYAFSFK